jgi:hypothetical protein
MQAQELSNTLWLLVVVEVLVVLGAMVVEEQEDIGLLLDSL